MSRCALNLNPEGMTVFGRQPEEQERVEPERVQLRVDELEMLEQQEREAELLRMGFAANQHPAMPPVVVLPEQDQPAPVEVDQPPASPLETEELYPPAIINGRYRYFRLVNFMLRRNNRIDNETEITIGSGNTIMSRQRFGLVQWPDYRTATSNLLIAVFSRGVLSTHTFDERGYLGGYRRRRLNFVATDDIIMEVTQRFGVAPELVIGAIMAMCSEEAERRRRVAMLRRQRRELERNAPGRNHFRRRYARG